MAQQTKRTFLFLGVIAGAVLASALVIPLAIVFNDSRDSLVETSPESAVTTPIVPAAADGESSVVDLQAPPAALAAIEKAGCSVCHTIPGVPGAEGTVGPNLTTIGLDAGSRKPSFSAEAYIKESILDPGAFIAPACPNGPCPEGVMITTFAQTLSPEEIDAIVGFLASKTGASSTTN